MSAPGPSFPLILEALGPIITALQDAGVRVYEDPKDVNPPCVYLAPPTLRFRFNRLDYEMDVALVICSSNTVKRAQYQELSDLLMTVQAALGVPGVTARPVDMWTADQSTLLGAYELTWTSTYKHRMRGTA